MDSLSCVLDRVLHMYRYHQQMMSLSKHQQSGLGKRPSEEKLSASEWASLARQMTSLLLDASLSLEVPVFSLYLLKRQLLWLERW